MKTLKLLAVLLFLNFNCTAQSVIKSLAGTWKVEGKEKFEVWTTVNDSLLTGEGYKMIDGRKVILENLIIRTKEGQVVYEATVPDQNEGQTISFVLNEKVKDQWQFENPAHDFPTQIIYKQVNEGRLFIEVLGNDGKGFSFYMDRR